LPLGGAWRPEGGKGKYSIKVRTRDSGRGKEKGGKSEETSPRGTATKKRKPQRKRIPNGEKKKRPAPGAVDLTTYLGLPERKGSSSETSRWENYGRRKKSEE